MISIIWSLSRRKKKSPLPNIKNGPVQTQKANYLKHLIGSIGLFINTSLKTSCPQTVTSFHILAQNRKDNFLQEVPNWRKNSIYGTG